MGAEPYRPERSGLYRPAVATRAPRRIPDERVDELFACLPSHRDRALVAFYVSTGTRASELLGATIADADPGQQLITVIRKGTRILRPVPASPDAFVWLRLYQAQMGGIVPARGDDPVLRVASHPVVFLASRPMLMTFFSSAGWEAWDLERQPVIPERMPVLIDDDLLFEDGPGAPRPVMAVNRWLRELPVSGAPAPSTWETYARVVKAWMEFLADRGIGVFDGRENLRSALSGYAEYRATGPVAHRFTASTWNQHVSVLASLYRWAIAKGHAAAEPFSYRTARAVFAGTARQVRVNLAARRRPKPHVTIKYLEPDFAKLFVRALASRGPGGGDDAGYRGRELARNACVAELALATGLRLQEFTYLLAWEIPALPRARTEVPTFHDIAGRTASPAKDPA